MCDKFKRKNLFLLLLSSHCHFRQIHHSAFTILFWFLFIFFNIHLHVRSERQQENWLTFVDWTTQRMANKFIGSFSKTGMVCIFGMNVMYNRMWCRTVYGNLWIKTEWENVWFGFLGVQWSGAWSRSIWGRARV